jgi:hypothetical protein
MLLYLDGVVCLQRQRKAGHATLQTDGGFRQSAFGCHALRRDGAQLLQTVDASTRAAMAGVAEKREVNAEQRRLFDELVEHIVGVIDYEYSWDHFGPVMVATIQAAYSQQDVDALVTIFESRGSRGGGSIRAGYARPRSWTHRGLGRKTSGEADHGGSFGKQISFAHFTIRARRVYGLCEFSRGPRQRRSDASMAGAIRGAVGAIEGGRGATIAGGTG